MIFLNDGNGSNATQQDTIDLLTRYVLGTYGQLGIKFVFFIPQSILTWKFFKKTKHIQEVGRVSRRIVISGTIGILLNMMFFVHDLIYGEGAG